MRVNSIDIKQLEKVPTSEFKATKLLTGIHPIRLSPFGFMQLNDCAWTIVDENNKDIIVYIYRLTNAPSFDGAGLSKLKRSHVKCFKVNY